MEYSRKIGYIPQSKTQVDQALGFAFYPNHGLTVSNLVLPVTTYFSVGNKLKPELGLGFATKFIFNETNISKEEFFAINPPGSAPYYQKVAFDYYLTLGLRYERRKMMYRLFAIGGNSHNPFHPSKRSWFFPRAYVIGIAAFRKF